MLKEEILKYLKPTINPYADERGRFAKKSVLIKEDYSGFESIIKEMNQSQVNLEKFKNFKCQNPNCKTAFSKYQSCGSCKKSFCDICLIPCENCFSQTCKFCIRIDYSKFKDIQICPGC